MGTAVPPVCHQTNLQPAFGGGEVYTRAFTRALLARGVEVRLYVQRDSPYWADFRPEGAAAFRLIPVRGPEDIPGHLPDTPAWVVTQGPLSEPVLRQLAERHVLTGFCHMPLFDRGGEGFRPYHRVYGVSRYVLDTLASRGITQAYPEPLYPAVELQSRGGVPGDIRATSPYAWDRRKFRDRLLGWLSPLVAGLTPWRRAQIYQQVRPSLTLGVVSLLGPIKQFPLLFEYLAPILAEVPEVRLEVFGRGGYASVRDIRRALAPLAGRVRFWGHQQAVADIYPLLDYLLAGLPEKEALGLNVLEAAACGTPVLAPRAPPFTETVADGRTGWLYDDPRSDGGADFRRCLAHIRQTPRLDPLAAPDHLARFAFPAFVARLEGVVADAWNLILAARSREDLT